MIVLPFFWNSNLLLVNLGIKRENWNKQLHYSFITALLKILLNKNKTLSVLWNKYSVEPHNITGDCDATSIHLCWADQNHIDDQSLWVIVGVYQVSWRSTRRVWPQGVRPGGSVRWITAAGHPLHIPGRQEAVGGVSVDAVGHVLVGVPGE